MPRNLFCYMWHPADYRADTRHLNREQSAAYREILDDIFLTGQSLSPPSIPDDDEYLIELTRAKNAKEWAKTRQALIDGPRAVLQSINGRISQKRMTAEIERALALSQTRRDAINRRWKKPTPEAAGATIPGGMSSYAALVASASSGGNGNGNGGNGLMNEKQFVFYYRRVEHWINEHYGKIPKSPESQADFEQEVGISWIRWQKEQLFHDKPAPIDTISAPT